jgi:hypothetical protein
LSCYAPIKTIITHYPFRPSIAVPPAPSFAWAGHSTDLMLYDLNGDGRIDDEDIRILFRSMGWQ